MSVIVFLLLLFQCGSSCLRGSVSFFFWCVALEMRCFRTLLGVYRLVGLVVKASTSRAEGPGFESRLRRDFFRGRVIPATSKLALQWLPCQAPGVIGSALGLVGPVSVYCDWVR